MMSRRTFKITVERRPTPAEAQAMIREIAPLLARLWLASTSSATNTNEGEAMLKLYVMISLTDNETGLRLHDEQEMSQDVLETDPEWVQRRIEGSLRGLLHIARGRIEDDARQTVRLADMIADEARQKLLVVVPGSGAIN